METAVAMSLLWSRRAAASAVSVMSELGIQESRDGHVIFYLLGQLCVYPSASFSARPLCQSTVLVDSSAVGNFIDQTLASSLNITSHPLSYLFLVQALDN
jgi:hypothetical protein